MEMATVTAEAVAITAAAAVAIMADLRVAAADIQAAAASPLARPSLLRDSTPASAADGLTAPESARNPSITEATQADALKSNIND
jgi:hypothetical protein